MSTTPSVTREEILNAARNGNLVELKDLLSSTTADVNQPDRDGVTPLHAAAAGGHASCVALLIEKKADTYARTTTKKLTPYQVAITSNVSHTVTDIIRAARVAARAGTSQEIINPPTASPSGISITSSNPGLSPDTHEEATVEQLRNEYASFERRFMSAACRKSDEFQVSRRLGHGDFGMVAEVTCTTPGFLWPNKKYALKACFNYEHNSSQARRQFIEEYLELVKLPPHPNVIRFLCEFVDEIRDNIRAHLPEPARTAASYGTPGRQTNRKTQFVVMELHQMSLKQLLESMLPTSFVPHRMVATIMSQVGSALLHLDDHRLAHRDVKPDNIMVDTRINDTTNHFEITRCVLIDFGTSCGLNEQMRAMTLVSGTGVVLGAHWGNSAHIAPELHSALGSAKKERTEHKVELDYSLQSVFELGVLGFEIVNGCHPVLGYPGSVTSRSTGVVEYGDDDIARISANRLGKEQASMLRRAVSCDTSLRPSLIELIECFDPTGGLSYSLLLSTPSERLQPTEQPRTSVIEQQVREQQTPEQRFMSTNCKSARSFEVSMVLGSGDNGMAMDVRCIEPQHPQPSKRYALKVCFNFGLSSRRAQGAFVNEYREHSTIANHPHIMQFMCEFFAEIDNSIRVHLPEFVQQSSIVHLQDGSIRNRKTQFFVLERFDASLEHLLKQEYHPPTIIPHQLVAMVVSQVALALRHLEQHRVVHRDIKLDNILVELNPDHRTAEEPSNSLPIKRCVVSDFGTACTLGPDLKDLMSVGPGGNVLSPMWGNQAHIAPELHSALGHATHAQSRSSPTTLRRLEIEIDYSRQPVFELGVLAFEIVLGTTPIDDYPASVTDRTTGTVRYNDSEIARIPTDRLGVEHASMLRRMVSCDPSHRPSLEDVLAFFDPHREHTHLLA